MLNWPSPLFLYSNWHDLHRKGLWLPLEKMSILPFKFKQKNQRNFFWSSMKKYALKKGANFSIFYLFIKIYLLFYIIKKEIHFIYIYIYVAYSRPNGLTDWAEMFYGHSRVAGWCHRLKNWLFFKIFFSTGNAGSFS